MAAKELVEYVARSLVDDPDAVKVELVHEDGAHRDRAARRRGRHGQGHRPERQRREGAADPAQGHRGEGRRARPARDRLSVTSTVAERPRSGYPAARRRAGPWRPRAARRRSRRDPDRSAGATVQAGCRLSGGVGHRADHRRRGGGPGRTGLAHPVRRDPDRARPRRSSASATSRRTVGRRRLGAASVYWHEVTGARSRRADGERPGHRRRRSSGSARARYSSSEADHVASSLPGGVGAFIRELRAADGRIVVDAMRSASTTWSAATGRGAGSRRAPAAPETRRQGDGDPVTDRLGPRRPRARDADRPPRRRLHN